MVSNPTYHNSVYLFRLFSHFAFAIARVLAVYQGVWWYLGLWKAFFFLYQRKRFSLIGYKVLFVMGILIAAIIQKKKIDY